MLFLKNSQHTFVVTIQALGIIRRIFQRAEQAAREKLNIDPPEKIILQLGRMVKRKGADNVVSSLAHLNRNGCDCKLLS